MIDPQRGDALDRANEARLVHKLVNQHLAEYEAQGHPYLEAWFMAEAHVAGSRGTTAIEINRLVDEALAAERNA